MIGWFNFLALFCAGLMAMGERRGEPGGMGEAQGLGEGDRLIFSGEGERLILSGEGEGVLAGESFGEVAGVDRGDNSSIS